MSERLFSRPAYYVTDEERSAEPPTYCGAGDQNGSQEAARHSSKKEANAQMLKMKEVCFKILCKLRYCVQYAEMF